MQDEVTQYVAVLIVVERPGLLRCRHLRTDGAQTRETEHGWESWNSEASTELQV